MKRQRKTSKKLTLDDQAVRELKRSELERLEQSVGGTFRTQFEMIDDPGDDGGGRC